MVRIPFAVGKSTGASGRVNSARTWRQAPQGGLGAWFRVGNCDGFYANLGSELGNGPDQGGSLGADGQPVAHIFDVGSGDDLSVGQPESRAYAEAGVGRVGVEGCLACLFEEVFERRPGRVSDRSSVLQSACSVRVEAKTFAGLLYMGRDWR